jgi:ankyrin repeat protein
METDQSRFLLARLYVDALLDKRTKSRVLSTLDTLSNESHSLENAYEDAISRLKNQLPEDAALAIRVITWVVYAKRALTIAELRHALAVELEETVFDSDNLLDTEDIISVCAGLVTIDKESNIIRLVHYTTQEYFDRTRSIWSPYGNLDITRTCLTYLSFDVFRSGNCLTFTAFKHRMATYPFMSYATRYWGKHASSIQESVPFHLVCTTLLDQGRLSSMAQVLDLAEWFDSMLQTLSTPEYFDSHASRTNVLHVLAHFGLDILAEKVLAHSDGKNNHWITEKDNLEQTCLYIAAAQGQDAMIRLLLSKDAKVSDEVKRVGSVLNVAVNMRHISTIKLLLDNGADINVKVERQTAEITALHHASAVSDTEMVRLLLQHGADMTIENIHGQKPLELAIERGSHEVVKLLLGEEAPVFTHNNTNIDVDAHNRNILHLAARHGELDTYLLVAGTGIDPSLRDAKGDDVLSYAASSGSLQVFEAALSVAPVSALQKGHWSSLHWACKGGNGEIVKLLLQCGLWGHSVALPPSEDKWSPADIAIHHGHLSMLKDLSDSCKAALGPFKMPARVPGTRREYTVCDGCLMVSRL